jgi:hypothetical protein
MGNCSSTSKCNPCGPNYDAINLLANKTASYARQANTSAVNAENSFLEFNALYLGAFASAPTVDNEGNPLQVGALYWNSVSNEIFVWNGTIWLPDAFNEFTPFIATGTTAARNLVNRTADVINVKDFGAVGDGVANDTAAIQAAIDFANNQGGGTVFFPEPSNFYACTQTFTIGSNTALVGSENRPVLKWTSPPPPTPAYVGDLGSARRAVINKDYVNGNQNISIINLIFDFSLIVGALTFARQVLYFYNCDSTLFDNCKVFSDGAMICNVRSTNYTVSNNLFDQAGTYASSDGVIDQWDGSQNGTIQNNRLVCKNLSKWPILVTATDTIGNPSIRPCKNFFISNNRITNARLAAISTMGRKDGCFNVIIDSNHIDGNLSDLSTYGAIDIRANDNVIISNNIIENTTKAGILLGREGIGSYPYENNNNVIIIGNTLKNISTTAAFYPINLASPIVNKINIVGNIIDGGAYNYAIFVNVGTTVTDYSSFANKITNGAVAPTNAGNLLNDINNYANDGNSVATIRSVVNNSINSTSQIFFDNGVNFLNSSGESVFLISHQPTNVNRLQAVSNDTGNPPTLSAAGTDTNIDLSLNSKGTGRVRYGTHVANADAPISGYIEIKDASGNIRKLAVIS